MGKMSHFREFQVRESKQEQQEEPCGEGWPRPLGECQACRGLSLKEGSLTGRKARRVLVFFITQAKKHFPGS